MVLCFKKKTAYFVPLCLNIELSVNISKSHYMKFLINRLFLGTKLCCIMF